VKFVSMGKTVKNIQELQINGGQRRRECGGDVDLSEKGESWANSKAITIFKGSHSQEKKRLLGEVEWGGKKKSDLGRKVSE